MNQLKNKIETILTKANWTVAILVMEINHYKNFVTAGSILNILKGGKPTDEEDEYLFEILNNIQIDLMAKPIK